MSERTMSASAFKAKCLALLDEVAATGTEIVVTKRGRRVAKLVAAGAPPSLQGSVTYAVPENELLRPIEAGWHADPA